MKTLRGRLTFMFLVLIGLSMIGTGLYASLLLKTSYLDSLANRLGKEGNLLAKSIDWNEHPDQLQERVEYYGGILDAQVTVLNPKGEVLADSQPHPDSSDKQTYSTEVKQTFQQSPETYHRVRGTQWLEVYVPVRSNQKPTGVIRIAQDLKVINHSLSRIWLSLIGGLVMAFAIAAWIGSRYASRIIQPIRDITQAAVDIARNQFHRRIPVQKRDEIGQLATAINRMGASLKYQLEVIRKSERRLTSVIETMESGLLLVDGEEKVVLANQAFYRLFKVNPSQRILSEQEETKELHWLYQQCKSSGKGIRRELHLYLPEERIIQASLNPIWDEKTGISVVTVLHDITPIRRLEKMRREFVANVSHELKTPVTSLRGFAETLLDEEIKDVHLQREFLEIILRESLRLERLIGDLLDLSQIESKHIRLKPESVPINQLIATAVKTVEKQIRRKGLKLNLCTTESFAVYVDPDRFLQILLNLLSNAVAYTSSGGTITLAVGKQENEERWWVQVTDTGIGIPEADQPRIFERFYRVDKARSRDSGGTGLGLAIVKHLVEAHHGEVHLESQTGKGTRFTLYFPL